VKLLPILTSADSFAVQEINPSAEVPKKKEEKEFKK